MISTERPPDDRIANRQFLLSVTVCPDLEKHWVHHALRGFHLYTHPNLEVTLSHTMDRHYFLLGFAFDPTHPDRSNAEILGKLCIHGETSVFLEALDSFGGQYAIGCVSETTCWIAHDAGGQYEVYYDTSFSAFGSQPRLLEKVMPAELHTDADTLAFFSSPVFLGEKIYVGDLTQHGNIRHLRPNHFIDIRSKQIRRYFPVRTPQSIPVDHAAEQALNLLRGFMQAAARRYTLHMGLTAGYDSRVLFLASLDTQCQYYTGRNSARNNDIDIRIAKQLVEIHHRPYAVREERDEPDSDDIRIQDLSIDFPRYRALPANSNTDMVISGHLSEIARSYFGTTEFPDGAALARILGLAGNPLPERIFDTWLKENKPLFDKLGYDYRDMFYWEERMGNWAAKGKTESALTTLVYSPFCSRKLLTILLGTQRADRDKHFNRLYDTMIRIASPAVARIPINPNRRQNIIRAMKKLRVYGVYRRVGIRLRLLRR